MEPLHLWHLGSLFMFPFRLVAYVLNIPVTVELA